MLYYLKNILFTSYLFIILTTNAQGYDPRIEHLEMETRRLTGEVETLKYQNMRLKKDIQSLRNEIDIKLEVLSKKDPQISTPKDKTKNIKNIIRETTGGTASILYDSAQSSLQRKNYDEAQKGFERIIKEYPEDKLAPNAYYWLGETFYAQKDYNKAAITFLEAKRKYPKSPKAGHSLYKLGMSLYFLNEKNEACNTFNEVEKTYIPKDHSLKDVLTKGMLKAGCY